MKRLCMFGGLCLMLAGAWIIFFICAFSTMIGQDLPDAARDAAQWRALWGQWYGFVFGAILVIAGIWLASRDPKPRAG
jgi:uncharacterized membrane protein